MVEEQSIIGFLSDELINLGQKMGLNHDQSKQHRDDLINSLTSQYGGQKVYIPSYRKTRHDRIKQGWKCGRTISRLAIDFEITERQVYNIVANL